MLTALQARPEPLDLDLEKTSLVVIDMQNTARGLAQLNGRDTTVLDRAANSIQRLAVASRASGRKVIYVAHRLSPDLREIGEPESVLWVKSMILRNYRQHPEWRDKLPIRGCWGAEILDEIKPGPHDIVVEKCRNSGFWGTNLDLALKTSRTRYLILTGALTNACVESTARDAYQLGYYAIVVPDACVPSSKLTEEATVFNVSTGFGWVADTADVLKALDSRGRVAVG